ncbi:ABC transporter permease [Clostridium estertheticum]|uniref:ABC transporter permease n=1 Tax=Clostridium estertheticum TaxID=238834 RepID=UPI0013E994E9|nr:ABC transporter permease [Clostridium estertheticum]MBZ9689024.1 ABC transporter permease [Clostridium estertheticum]
MSSDILINLLAQTLRIATPLIFAALGGIFSEKSGVVNIGLEGMMVIGAFFGVYGSYLFSPLLGPVYGPLIGILFGVIAGGVLGLIHAVLSIHLRADQVISGTAINLFSTALASFLIFKLFNGKGGQTDIVTGLSYNIPNWIRNIPLIGDFIDQLNWFVILAIILVFVSHYVLYKTPLGLRIRAVGEHPKAADTLGINVYKIRYLCVILSGMLAGLGGAALSLGITPLYREGMVAGRGFIALAAVIFGNWKPFGALGASLLFAFGSAFNIFAQGLSWNLPTEVYDVIPYVLTMLALAGFVGKTTGPLASGKPYDKGSR